MITVKIGPEPIEPLALPPIAGAGACAEFTGIVRADENESPIGGLRYEAYQPMAETVMRNLLTEISAEHGLLAAHVRHRIGDIRVGEAAIHLALWSRHRGPAFNALVAFMNRLKQDVPIWKTDTLPPHS
ncbi:MAG: molybdenum cofactor biosynthesis protein MoaE [Opitutaceae bacterium]|jgi:molybdopterin synthase catalytic subunit|nr:molybdenum cofactor biosynthesis protein MoaE [Opitutaceae bacterium]